MFALITFVPLVWLLAATMTAGVQKIWHSDPRIGFLAQARVLDRQWPELEQGVLEAKASKAADAIAATEKRLQLNRVLHFNNLLDAVVAGVFLFFMTAILLLSIREWILLLARRKPAALRETKPVWLPDYALAQSKPLHLSAMVGLGLALAKELSGEAQLERVHAEEAQCACVAEERLSGAAIGKSSRPLEKQRYLEMTQRRFEGVRRCC